MKLNIVREQNDSDSIFIYIPNFVTNNDTKKLREAIKYISLVPNYNYSETKIIRYQKWYQLNGSYFCGKWKTKFKRWESNPYFEELNEFQNLVTKKLSNLGLEHLGIDIPQFNSCLINKYLQNNYIREHRDTDKAFGKEPVITGISLGSSAKINFRRVKYSGSNKGLSKRDKEAQYLNFSWTLKPNSLFIMAGSSQKYWTHEVPKLTSLEPRFSFTFRHQI